MSKAIAITDEKVISKIYQVRGKRVMLDSDLAELYAVETKALNQAVKRNRARFPDDFMFQLTETEWLNLRSQNVTSSWGGRRMLPYVFTENGVAMLSSVLNSKTAVQVNIQIVRVFTRLREILTGHKNVLLRLEQFEKRMLKQDTTQKKLEQDIKDIFDLLKNLITPPSAPRKRIGFKKD